jgi:hypothetical protein
VKLALYAALVLVPAISAAQQSSSIAGPALPEVGEYRLVDYPDFNNPKGRRVALKVESLDNSAVPAVHLSAPGVAEGGLIETLETVRNAPLLRANDSTDYLLENVRELNAAGKPDRRKPETLLVRQIAKKITDKNGKLIAYEVLGKNGPELVQTKGLKNFKIIEDNVVWSNVTSSEYGGSKIEIPEATLEKMDPMTLEYMSRDLSGRGFKLSAKMQGKLDVYHSEVKGRIEQSETIRGIQRGLSFEEAARAGREAARVGAAR